MRENNNIDFFNKHKMFMCTMVILRLMICIVFYVCNWLLYKKVHIYYGVSGIEYKESFVMMLLITLQIISLTLSIESIYKFSTPTTLRFYKHYRIVFLSYIIMLISTYITITNDFKLLVYFLLWGGMFLTSILINVFILRKNLQLSYQEYNELLEVYCIDIEENEKNGMEKFKSESIKLILFFVCSSLVYDYVMSNIWLFIVYEAIYVFFLIWRYSAVFKCYYPKGYHIISLLNGVLGGAGSLIVFLINTRILDMEILGYRTLEELILVQVLFLIPLYFWGISRYRSYKSFEYMKKVENLDLYRKGKK